MSGFTWTHKVQVESLTSIHACYRRSCGQVGRRVDLIGFAPQRIVDDDGSAVGQRFYRMAHITRNDGDQTRSGDLSRAVDGHLKLAFDHLVNFFLRMEVLVNGRATGEVVMRERHARRLEIPPIPARQALNDIQAAGVNKGHRGSPLKHSSTAGPAR